MIMMETKRCPACSRSLLEMCPTCSRSLSEKPGPDEEDKAAGSKEKKKSSREEGSELMVVLPSQGGKERKKICDGGRGDGGERQIGEEVEAIEGGGQEI